MFALKVIANLGRTTHALTSAQARFIEESFYMDDGMSSLPEPQEEVELLVAVVWRSLGYKRTRSSPTLGRSWTPSATRTKAPHPSLTWIQTPSLGLSESPGTR